ncbi:ABC transporter ATP-binding protein [uncultured Polaribacter sp.]|uniref:ABC transporter ATP-binding protein n=1 Tax=uncultured Polaribacter sp. TaxID=174711 RepID=UPI0026207142|nr:ABC transporter ATP-binding protein [uncultured Polaribacter sp.]
MNIDKKHIVISTESLTIGYQHKKQDKIVLSNINFSIKKGELVCVLGKNGIGKSTLLRTLSKVQKPISGHINLEGKKLSHYKENELSKKLSLVLTERLPESQLTVYELIALGRQPHTNWLDTITANDTKKIELAISQTDIFHLKDKRFYELSDGQLQRVLIARALAQDTEVIILDEPTAHLDMHQTLNIFELLKKLALETKKTIIISSHEINIALKMADKIVLLKENEMQFGTTDNLSKANAFDNLFPNNLLIFNKTLQQFVINKS